ncbi:MAG: DMT family transporter [Legionellales bacterium]|nr:DMT family transporter [Legionellales bacterium]
MKNSFKIFLLVLILGSIWGAGPIINKYAISNGVSPVGYSFLQFIGPAIVLTIIAKLQNKLYLSKKHIPYYLVCGLIGQAIPSTILHICAPYLPSNIMPVIINLVPIFVYPLALLVKQEAFQIWRFIGILIGGVGIISLSNVPTTSMLPWVTLALITPLCFAVTVLFINPFKPKNTPPISLAAGMLLSAALLVTPILILTDSYYAITFPLNYQDYAILIRICMHSFGYVIFFTIVQKAGPVYYSLVSGVVILSGILLGYLILGETLNNNSIFTVCAILLAIIIINLSQKKARI